MNYSDHDGKSKTASAVDQDHYPEQNEVDRSGFDTGTLPTHDQIAERAHQLWIARGRPHGSPDQDWQQAEEELRAAVASRNAIRSSADASGSVQH